MRKKLILLIATLSLATVMTAPATIQACGQTPPPVNMTTNSHGFGS